MGAISPPVVAAGPMPPEMTVAVGSCFLTAAYTVFNSAVYEAASAPVRQNAKRFGSFQTSHVCTPRGAYRATTAVENAANAVLLAGGH